MCTTSGLTNNLSVALFHLTCGVRQITPGVTAATERDTDQVWDCGGFKLCTSPLGSSAGCVLPCPSLPCPARLRTV
jgi:hypothetical protein